MADTILTTKATASGGREGHVKSDNGIIDVNLSMPKGEDIPSDASNPEQLFAAGYAACFDGALNLMASKQKKDITSTITSEVSLLKDPEDNGFKLGVTLHAEISGVSQSEAEELVHKAHDFCPYSKATRGNVDVELVVKTN
ncbi:organic hydroperoxide resistance protein [Salipaludibacillus agaradhaerens]|uniref:Organic hydroperoxide resistance protein n=1 Tax=Salipaludibacillus agaradhaerens TaxID=76935 RepID=A0A9Q4B1J4_SALAG|nr:organic hydroperoxide resistance protein [Salipaludibacillus agaradhaerens]MCR6096327.1 organic hydroperoxide resistance protein [Salipaludibacillus agaradhaerens]MCR6114114.1 organic hydroperoxide resistance protein [Salipaludibacillus agaradhaerens]